MDIYSNKKLEVYWRLAKERRNYESVLTSYNSNAIHYGAPVYMHKGDLWPPLSSQSDDISPAKEKATIEKARVDLICSEIYLPLPENDETDIEVTEALRTRFNKSQWIAEFRPSAPPEDTRELYKSLPSSDSIRILEIEPGEVSTPLVCSLQPSRLHSSTVKYEALSYTWGSQRGKTLNITCNGEVKAVKINLHDALNRLRLPKESRCIWVDAICIDQSNERERVEQVQLMGSIYRNAENVLIWLGKDDESQAASAFSVLCAVIRKWQKDNGDIDAEQPTYSLGEQLDQRSELEDLPPADSDLWQSISSLFNRSWFWRLWVVQEVVLARSASVIWGEGVMSWRWIGLAAAITRTNNYEVLRRHIVGGVYNAYLMYRLRSRDEPGNPLRNASFVDLLRLTRQFEVTDARDRIYGLLGLPASDNDPNNGSMFMAPDYTLSEDEVFQKVGTKIINNSKSLELLSSVQYRVDRMECDDTDFPSWIPQWEEVFTSTLAPWDVDEKFAAGRGFPLQRKEIAFPNRLVISALEIDKTVETLPFMWHSLALSIFVHPQFKNYFQTESGFKYLCTTLTAGRSWYGPLIKNNTSQLADFAAYVVKFLDDKLPVSGRARGFHGLRQSGNKRSCYKRVLRCHGCMKCRETATTIDL